MGIRIVIDSPMFMPEIQKLWCYYPGHDIIRYMGEGGSIPFMAMLGDEFPSAQFLITGVLGPKSNAHGPNEFLDIPTGKRLTACVSHVLAQHHTR